MRRGILAVGILAGTIIGAGVFSLPYIFSKVGVVAGVLMLISFACLYGVIHARYGGVLHAFRDGGNPGQFAHFAKRAFSPRAARFASGIVVAELVLTLTAYIVLSAGFAGLLGVPRTVAWAVFWAIGSAAFFLKTRALGVLEIFGTVGVFLICALIGFSTDGATLPLSPREIPGAAAIFSYIGAMIFSFSGRPAIPHVGALFGRVRIPRRIIFWGMLIPLAFYLIFPMSVLRLTDTPAPDTVSGVLALSPVVAVLVEVISLPPDLVVDGAVCVPARIKDLTGYLNRDVSREFEVTAIEVGRHPLARQLAAWGRHGGVFLGVASEEDNGGAVLLDD